MALVLICVDLAWAAAAAQARRHLKSSRAMRIANRLSATTMAGAAAAFFPAATGKNGYIGNISAISTLPPAAMIGQPFALATASSLLIASMIE